MKALKGMVECFEHEHKKLLRRDISLRYIEFLLVHADYTKLRTHDSHVLFNWVVLLGALLYAFSLVDERVYQQGGLVFLCRWFNCALVMLLLISKFQIVTPSFFFSFPLVGLVHLTFEQMALHFPPYEFLARSIWILKSEMFQRVLEVSIGYVCRSDPIIRTSQSVRETHRLEKKKGGLSRYP